MCSSSSAPVDGAFGTNVFDTASIEGALGTRLLGTSSCSFTGSCFIGVFGTMFSADGSRVSARAFIESPHGIIDVGFAGLEISRKWVQCTCVASSAMDPATKRQSAHWHWCAPSVRGVCGHEELVEVGVPPSDGAGDVVGSPRASPQAVQLPWPVELVNVSIDAGSKGSTWLSAQAAVALPKSTHSMGPPRCAPKGISRHLLQGTVSIGGHAAQQGSRYCCA